MKLNLSPLEWVLTVVFGGALYLASMAGVWWLWCFVWSGLWPEGPGLLTDPPYATFVATTILIAWVKSFLGVKK